MLEFGKTAVSLVLDDAEEIEKALDDEYEILRKVRDDDFCKVWLVRQKEKDETALLHIYSERNNQGWQYDDLWSNLHLASDRLWHPGLQAVDKITRKTIHVSRYADDEVAESYSDTITWYIEKYPAGKTLADIVHGSSEDGAESAAFAIDLAKRICDCLTYIHSFEPPWVYGRLSPFTITVEEDGSVRLLGGGFRTAIWEEIGYAAPEQCDSNLPYDARYDIFGLGMVMYYVLTKRSPVRQPYSRRLPIREINPAVSEELEAIVMKCMAYDPDSRYQSAEELRQALMDLEAAMAENSAQTNIFAPNSVKEDSISEPDRQKSADDEDEAFAPDDMENIPDAHPYPDAPAAADIIDSTFRYAAAPRHVTEFLCANAELQLLFVSTGETISYNDLPTLRIGRAKDCDIVLSQAEVSRSHARLYHEGNTWYLADIGSKNGVWLNGDKLITQVKYELRPNDVIDIARQEKLGFFPTPYFDAAGNVQEIDREMFWQPELRENGENISLG